MAPFARPPHTDRAFINPRAEARDFQFQVQVVGDIGDPFLPGDHLPIRIPIQKATLGNHPGVAHQTRTVLLHNSPSFTRRMLKPDDTVFPLEDFKDTVQNATVQAHSAVLRATHPYMALNFSCVNGRANVPQLAPQYAHLGAVRPRSEEPIGQCFDNATFACTNFPPRWHKLPRPSPAAALRTERMPLATYCGRGLRKTWRSLCATGVGTRGQPRNRNSLSMRWSTRRSDT